MSVNLVAERINRGLSIRAAAAEMEIPRQVLMRAEHGGRPHPRYQLKIARFYGYEVTAVWPFDNGDEAAA